MRGASLGTQEHSSQGSKSKILMLALSEFIGRENSITSREDPVRSGQVVLFEESCSCPVSRLLCFRSPGQRAQVLLLYGRGYTSRPRWSQTLLTRSCSRHKSESQLKTLQGRASITARYAALSLRMNRQLVACGVETLKEKRKRKGEQEEVVAL